MTYRIMFACVTVEVAMVVSPAVHYRPDEIHLFRFIRDSGTKRAELYEDHYKEVCRQLKENLPDTIITEHCSDPVYDFRAMASRLDSLHSSLLTKHPDAEFLVNISSDPAEFVAALGVFCFLNRDTVMFRVPTREYCVSEEEFRALHCADGKAVGLSRKVYPPKELKCFSLRKPDETLVRALRIYSQMMDGGTEPTGVLMISALKEKGLWTYREPAGDCRTDLADREKQWYERNYNLPWKERDGWMSVTGGRGTGSPARAGPP